MNINKLKESLKLNEKIALVNLNIPLNNSDKKQILNDVLVKDPDEKYFVKSNVINKIIENESFKKYMVNNENTINDIYDDYNSKFRTDNITGTLTCNIGNSAHRNGQKVIYINSNYNVDYALFNNNKIQIRKLTPNECEQLQSYPIDYTKYGLFLNKNGLFDRKEITDGARYKMIGNGITSIVSKTIIESVFDTDQHNILSLFSGCGGTEALLPTNLKTVAFSEIDKNASAVFQNNHPNITNFGDLTNINYELLPEFDMLFGGFPCQSFSMIGLRKGFEENRGQLIFHVFNLLLHKKPKYLMMENVKGLLSHDKGRSFITILEGLTELGYEFDFELVNSKNFGVAQNRERVFIVGRLKE